MVEGSWSCQVFICHSPPAQGETSVTTPISEVRDYGVQSWAHRAASKGHGGEPTPLTAQPQGGHWDTRRREEWRGVKGQKREHKWGTGKKPKKV